MANAVYPLAKERLLEWAMGSNPPEGGATLCVIGVKDTYSYSAGHETLDDVSGSAIVLPETELDNVTLDFGVVDADDTDLNDMTIGETLNAFIVYFKWASTTLLLCYMDTPTNATIPQLINTEAGRLEFSASGIFEI